MIIILSQLVIIIIPIIIKGVVRDTGGHAVALRYSMERFVIVIIIIAIW